MYVRNQTLAFRCSRKSEVARLLRLAPHRAHAGRAFGALAGANFRRNATIASLFSTLGKIDRVVPTPAGRPGDEEARLHATVRADHCGKLRRVATHRGICAHARDGGEVLQDAAQLLRALRDEPGTKILRMISLQRTQELLEYGQILGAQREVGAEIVESAEGVRIGDVDREKRNLAGAEPFASSTNAGSSR